MGGSEFQFGVYITLGETVSKLQPSSRVVGTCACGRLDPGDQGVWEFGRSRHVERERHQRNSSVTLDRVGRSRCGKEELMELFSGFDPWWLE